MAAVHRPDFYSLSPEPGEPFLNLIFRISQERDVRDYDLIEGWMFPRGFSQHPVQGSSRAFILGFSVPSQPFPLLSWRRHSSGETAGAFRHKPRTGSALG